ncbi:MAG: trypsin-like peptidase domain-containing protein, partial [Bacteroidota bacterium]|nr:trypsin-like peptidase domain-containing protein [Bacteroidota bacterium]
MINNKKFFTVFFLSLFCVLFFVQSVNAETYTVTDFHPTGCPYGNDLETNINPLPPPSSDTVEIISTGFGNRDLVDGIPETVYIPNPTTGKLYCIERSQTADGVAGLMSWNDSEIELKLRQGLGNSLGSYIILRTYSDVGDNQGICVRGDLLHGIICTSFTYSDWTVCQSDGIQTRTILNSYPNDCSGGTPVLNQSCTPFCTNGDYSCDDWSECSVDGNQTRICSKISNCEGGIEMPAISQSCVYIPPTCTSWTYSDWPNCQPNGTQTRTVINSSPNNCVGGNPVLTQDCNYVPPCSESDYSCGDWSDCSSSGKQTRACSKNTNCQGGASSPNTTQACTYTPTCIYFTYSSWLECSSNGNQTRNIISRYPSNCQGGASPQTSRSCTPPCDADTWTCDDWSDCSLSGIQARNCIKTFDCPNVQTAPPVSDRYCEPPSRLTIQNPPSGSDEILNQDSIIKSTVKLICPFNRSMASQGSGTIIDSSGTILTNKHVVSGTIGCYVGFIDSSYDEPYFGEKQIADLLKVSLYEDIAILKIRNPNNVKLTSIDITKGSGNLRLGVEISTYGYPAVFGEKITYTSGDFSGTDGSYLKTTAILEYGNSGGGAYLKDGTFVGIPSAVVKGELNALGYILSIDAINSWLGNSSVTYGNTGNNEYSRVSVLEDIDISELGSLKLFIPDTDTKGNLSDSVKNKVLQNSQNVKEQPQSNQTQEESIIIEFTDVNQKTNPEQNNSISSEKGNNSNIKASEQRKNTFVNAVQEIVKVAEHDGGVGQEIKAIAQTQTQNQEKLETGIQKIQSRSGFTKFFIGPNYDEIKN